MRCLSLSVGALFALLACHAIADPEPGQAPADDGSELSGDEDADAGSGPTSNSSGDGGSSTSTGNSTNGFVPQSDVEHVSSCDPFQQDCEAGEKCVPYASYGSNWDANKCVPVLGDGNIGDPCTYDGAAAGTDSCGADSMCWNLADVDGQLIGTCSSFCTGSPDDPTCPAGSSCSISCDGSLTVCIQQCDPILQDCLGLGCYWAYNGFNCLPPTQDIEVGQPCGYVNDCAPGLICLDGAAMPDCQGAACCGEFCNVYDPACNLAGTECVPFYEQGMAPPGEEHIGVCIVPGA